MIAHLHRSATSGGFLAGLFALVAIVLLAGTDARGLTVDEFEGDQDVVANPPPEGQPPVPAFSSIQRPDAVGGTRGITVVGTAGTPRLKIEVETVNGFLSHSQDATVAGYSIVKWDRNLSSALSPAGLGGLDLLQDGGTAVRLEVLSFDYPNSRPITFSVILYDQSDPAGLKSSCASQTLSNAIVGLTNVDLPFSSFTPCGQNGPANLANVGAIVLSIAGANPDVDLILEWIGTNGSCRLVPNAQNRVLDQCGVCGGDGTSCLDCAGVPFGTSTRDQCGVCGGDNSSCRDCAGTPNGSAQLDRCGVCGGDGRSCLSCTESKIDKIQAQMDGGAKALERIIDGLLAKLQKANTKFAAYAAKTKKSVHELQVRNWIISWTLPSIIRTCENQIFCAAVSNLTLLGEYHLHNDQLRDAGYEVIAKLRRIRALSKQQLAAYTQQLLKTYTRNKTFAESVPASTSSCG